MRKYDETSEYVALMLETSDAYADGVKGQARVAEALQSSLYKLMFGIGWDISHSSSSADVAEKSRLIVHDGIARGFAIGYSKMSQADPPIAEWSTLPLVTKGALPAVWMEAVARGDRASKNPANVGELAARSYEWVWLGVGALVVGLASVGAWLVWGRASNPIAGKKPNTKGVPTQAIDWIVGKYNVGTPDDEIRANIEGRMAKAADASQALIRRAGAYAVWRHRKNQDLYTAVMSGRIGARAVTR